jgi:putative tricarboxylic transport membrane protein
MRKGNFIVTAILEGMGIFVIVYSYKLGLQTVNHPGPGLFPFLLGILLCLVALPALVRSIRDFTKGNHANKAHESEFSSNLWKLGFAVACLLEFFFFLEILGFFIATFLFLFGLFLIGSPRRWLFCSLLSVVTVIFTYLVFNTLLQVALPWGFLK